MRILLTTHQFLPDYASGTEILALHTAQEFMRRGHEVQVFTAVPSAPTLADSARFDRYAYEGISVTRFRHAHAPMGSQDNVAELEYNNLLVARNFDALIDTFRPDVVHFFHLARLSASVVDRCLARGIPTALTPTDFWLVCPLSRLRLPDGATCRGPDRWSANCVRHVAATKGAGVLRHLFSALPDRAAAGLVRIASRAPFRHIGPARLVAALADRAEFLRGRMNRIDRVFVPTRIMQETLQRHGLDPARTVFCPYGIKLSGVSPREPHREGPLRIGYIGTLAEHKGVHVLIEAVRKLPGRNLTLGIYGALTDYPGYVARLKERADGDPRIVFHGKFANERIGAVLSELDLLVVPSLWLENAPLVAYSAQWAGRPVLASDMPGLAEIVTHGENGLLFPAGDTMRLAEILEGLAQDRGELVRLAGEARKPRSIAEYADQLLSHYDQLTYAEHGA